MSKYTISFERFIGRTLTTWERDIIAPLEYTRQHCSNHRVVVVDPPGYDSRTILCAYFSYLHHKIDPYGDFLVMAKTKRDAATLSGYLSRSKSPWLTPASGRKPDNIRGLTFNYALLLDTQAYRAKGRSKLAQTLSSVAPIILNRGTRNFIIIHIRSDCPDPDIPPIYIRDPSVPKARLPQKIPGPKVYFLTLCSSPPPGATYDSPLILIIPPFAERSTRR
ncbi:MAG: hypothetical protein K1W01_03220 [Muribaculaceae bacterium]